MKMKWLGIGCAMLVGCVAALAQDIALPAPVTSGGMALADALQARQSIRNFDSAKSLTPQELSNLLWAAWGINRADGKRTAPTACNNQEIDLYVCLASGVYLYDAKANALKQLQKVDLRKSCGKQPFVGKAPVCLVLVGDLSRVNRIDDGHKQLYAWLDTGYISQNIYLHCAANKMHTVAIGMVDREELGKALKLKAKQEIVISHPVGFPGK